MVVASDCDVVVNASEVVDTGTKEVVSISVVTSVVSDCVVVVVSDCGVAVNASEVLDTGSKEVVSITVVISVVSDSVVVVSSTVDVEVNRSSVVPIDVVVTHTGICRSCHFCTRSFRSTRF